MQIEAFQQDMTDHLAAFRERALATGAPAEQIGRWAGLARPAVILAPTADGPEAGWFGDERRPAPGADGTYSAIRERRPEEMHLIATVDLAKVAASATDLPLPADGHLLFFASTEIGDENTAGSVDYLPAGTGLGDRARDYDDYDNYELLYDRGIGTHEDLEAGLRKIDPLRPVPVVTLPDHEPTYSRPLFTDPLAERFEDAGRLRRAWHDTRWTHGWPGAHLQLGGWASAYGEEFGDPVRYAAATAKFDGAEGAPDGDSWVLLAQWIGFLDHASMFWTIPAADLEELRFDRARVILHWRP
ncbi:DUF1963 domain-containing protein [Myceligenerans pegani]|uniref:DUF1963 domain-containing protein n=1 Tax=Myceligenerans pegani TaxID=2776917 RepID=A0ABR9MVN5_9MICO|nr:DUF1963 domain-containing protein [Myceligenerans sp. TRM 65318]MBE1875449.1 DUF1963 domain-containing protein [Myceligenerans sp. TRM 65318]MBE3017720.1 DUF1963 domain-containing protein [Myceligenerans sp. TRM 65318]